MKKIKKILAGDIQSFDQRFNDVLSTKSTLLYKVINYIKQSSGKQIRPICCIIASGILGETSDKTFRSAILIELLHTATLIHDDIVDDAQLRRSMLAINTVWKNKIAVLTGDYFLAKGLSFAISQKDYDILGLTSEVVQRIVEGELIQIEKTKKLDLNIEQYNNIIRLKTGSLFECAFKAGAISSNANDQQLYILSEIGQLIGLMFQIKDDILDYSPSSIIGKKSGNDIKEGKINLPLLYAIDNAERKEKKYIFNVLRKKTNTLNDIKEVQAIVKKYNGVERADLVVKKYHKKTLQLLSNFQEGIYKESLQELLLFLIQRTV